MVNNKKCTVALQMLELQATHWEQPDVLEQICRAAGHPGRVGERNPTHIRGQQEAPSTLEENRIPDPCCLVSLEGYSSSTMKFQFILPV
ncbi:hypothetical protein QTO34_008011 [Cnephaeus nilssonii]|uniref:Uncharacterized protein n=1 Tax=Cnephaeus nilssonii TaxID=3371016 RepID=A0AA40IAK9_CNENI|nr:hypothetical protein QTO34_008011 [Eptesicus nilssonii]